MTLAVARTSLRRAIVATARHSGKVMDVVNASTANNAEVKQYSWNGGANQQWTRTQF